MLRARYEQKSDLFNLVWLVAKMIEKVPVLSRIGGQEGNIPDSLKMTFHMTSNYPELMPAAHEKQIRQLLIDLHALNYFSLSFPGRPGVIQGIVDAIESRLDNPTISNRYRKALEFKLSM